MKKIILTMISILLIILMLTYCKTEDNSMKIITYLNGDSSVVRISNENEKEVMSIIDELLLSTDDMLRVYFDQERIDNLKQNEKCIEVILDKTTVMNTGFLGEINAKKILLPLSGDFSATEKINVVTLFIGEDEYTSGPLTATGGLELITRLENIVFTEK